MKYISKNYTNTLEIKQSKFITHLMPFSQYIDTLKQLKQNHPKARHFVVAYRYLNEYKQIVEHSSDDGEPKGTSGKPSLMVLQGNDMINTAVIIVRYFGGTKLGTGGLVRAYSDSINLVLDLAELIEYKQEVIKIVSFDYEYIRKVEYECNKLHVEIIKKEFDALVVFDIKASKDNINDLFENLGRILK